MRVSWTPAFAGVTVPVGKMRAAATSTCPPEGGGREGGQPRPARARARLWGVKLRYETLVVPLVWLGTVQPACAEEPAVHRFLMSTVQLTPAQVVSLQRGEVVTRQLPAADKPEMAAFGAVLVRASQDTFLERFRDLASFRKTPTVLDIGRLGSPPQVEDLASLTAEEDDLQAVRDCRPGACDVKMARSAMDRLARELDWSAPDARSRAVSVLKRMLVDYASAYIRGGTSEMATYHDKQRPLDAPAEFRKLLAASPYLYQYLPAFHAYVEQYPTGRLEGAEDLFYWTKEKLGPKPTVAMYHVTLWKDPKQPGQAVIASKQIYASHYFQACLELLALVDAPGGGFYLMDLYRARVDPPTGLLSGVVLGKIRNGIEEGVAQGLRAARAKAEARETPDAAHPGEP